MKASFKVLDQPWIPIVRLDGEEKVYGIRETLFQAHSIREISLASPLEEYSLYRFLGLFLMDALRPESEMDIEDCLAAGHLDPDAIEAYISACESEGVSFDLFDENRPFLQSKYDPVIDKEIKPVSVLDCTRPSGNNHVHFEHMENQRSIISPAESLRLLLTTYLFCTAGAQGYPSGVNASPPYFGVIKGQNLFETLAYTLLPCDLIQIDIDDPPVLWRRTNPIVPKKEVGKTSWMHGMLFPTRRICLIPNEQNEVTGVYLCQGENYINKESWHDPYVTYRRGDKGVFPMRPNADRPIWRNLCDIVNIPGGCASLLFQQYQTAHIGEMVDLTLYGVETSQASYLAMYRHDISIPVSLTESAETIDMLYACVATSEALSRTLRKCLLSIQTMGEAGVSLAVRQYYRVCEQLFWELCETVNGVRDIKPLYISYCDDISSAAMKAYSDALVGMNLRASVLAKAAIQKDVLMKAIHRIKEEARL